MRPAEEVNRYTRHSILRSEQMYGEGFQSPGQAGAMRALCGMLALRQGMHVLEIGSGLGGAAFYLAREHGVSVLGLDTAPEMIALSRERLAAQGLSGIEFLHGDVRDVPLTRHSFDVVWTRDTVLYVPDKEAIWKRVHDLLRPGGQLLVTDFCRGADALAPEFAQYATDAGYHLQTVDGYAATLRDAGFEDVQATDNSAAFEQSLVEEQARLAQRRETFLQAYTQEDFDYLWGRWQRKLGFCRRGQLVWGLFLARASADRS